MFLFIQLSGCSLWSNKPSLESVEIKELLSQIRLIGTGKGRLGVKSQQYLFGFDSALKENNDWIFAANIPLHGEEVMIFSRLDLDYEKNASIESLEGRIEQEILGQFTKNPQISKQLMIDFREDLRGITRLILSDKLKINKECSKVKSVWKCRLGNKEFDILIVKDEVHVKKNVDKGFVIELVAQNLTASFFTRTNIFFYSARDQNRSHPILSLELFWK